MRAIYFIIVLFVSLNYSWAQNGKALLDKAKDEFTIGNYMNAINYCNQATKKDKNLKEVNFISGLAYYNLKDTIKAIDYFGKEIQINKSDYRSYLYRAKLNARTYDLSATDFSKAIEMQPSNFLLYLEEGHLNYYHLKYNEAMADYIKAISLRPNLDDAYYYLGFCKLHLNDTTNACLYWNKVEELDDYKEYEFIQQTCTKQK